jgi:epoxyqueuosine reductase
MTLFNKEQLNKWGIVDYGYTTKHIPISLNNYNNWLNENWHLPLNYLAGNRAELRQDLKNFWPLYKSALVFLFSYHQTHCDLNAIYNDEENWNGLKLASFTLGFEGEDYHHIIKRHLIEIGNSIQKTYPHIEYKLTLDTHPVLERDLAFQAGLGWFGKNSMLINKKHGSFFLIGSLLLNNELPLEYPKLDVDHCGQCTRCIDACPTSAIDVQTRTIIARDCISTFTIEEFKLETIPSEKMNLDSGFIFGCDICQDVCPWNQRIDRQADDAPKKNQSNEQKKIVNFFLLQKVEVLLSALESMSTGEFKRLFQKTSFARSGKRGLLKNIRFHYKNVTR